MQGEAQLETGLNSKPLDGRVLGRTLPMAKLRMREDVSQHSKLRRSEAFASRLEVRTTELLWVASRANQEGRARTIAFTGWSLTHARMTSQTTSKGASVFVPSGLACVEDTRYPVRDGTRLADYRNCRAKCSRRRQD
jgi:hypothetical protein